QTDIVIDSTTGSDVTGSGNEPVMASQDPAYQRVVQVNDWRQRIERSFGQRTFRTSAGGRRRFAGHTANKFHVEFRQLEIMNWIEDGEGTDRTFRRIIAAAGQDRCDSIEYGAFGWQPPMETRSHLGQVGRAFVLEVGSRLQVTGILAGSAIHYARI